jgi:hypothetical protein
MPRSMLFRQGNFCGLGSRSCRERCFRMLGRCWFGIAGAAASAHTSTRMTKATRLWVRWQAARYDCRGGSSSSRRLPVGRGIIRRALVEWLSLMRVLWFRGRSLLIPQRTLSGHFISGVIHSHDIDGRALQALKVQLLIVLSGHRKPESNHAKQK